MRTINNQLLPVINALHGNAAFVWLLEMHPNAAETIYLCRDNKPLQFDGQLWNPFPFDISPMEEDGSGKLTSVTITVSGVSNEISTIIDKNRAFTGQEVRIILVHRNYTTDDSMALASQRFRVQSARVNEESAVFTVGNEDLMKFLIPSGKFLRGRCRFAYKGTFCNYAGALTTCNRTLRTSNGCEEHANQSRFGGFPGIPRQ